MLGEAKTIEWLTTLDLLEIWQPWYEGHFDWDSNKILASMHLCSTSKTLVICPVSLTTWNKWRTKGKTKQFLSWFGPVHLQSWLLQQHSVLEELIESFGLTEPPWEPPGHWGFSLSSRAWKGCYDRVAHIISFCTGLDPNVSKVNSFFPRCSHSSKQPPYPPFQLPQELCVLRLQREANAVALAPDGRRAAVGLQAQRHRRSPSCRRQQTRYCIYIYIYILYILNNMYMKPYGFAAFHALRNRGTFNLLILSTGWHGPRSSKHRAFRQLARHSCRICSLLTLTGCKTALLLI